MFKSLTSKQIFLSLELHPRYDFNKYFGFIIPEAKRFFDKEIQPSEKQPGIFFKLPLPQFFDKTNAKIEEYIPIWKELKTYSDGRIAFHIYKMFYSISRDQELEDLSLYDRNILLWAALLHDICKRGRPLVPGKDPIHPFKSAWKSLYYFNDPFGFTELSKQDFKEWDGIFEEGFHMKGDMEVQNHAIIPSIKRFMDSKLPNKDFEKELLYYILLHQSVPTLSLHPHSSLLDPVETEIPKYFDKRMFRVFRFLLRHDSLSYLLYSPDTSSAFGDEIDKHLGSLYKYIQDSL